MFSRRLGLGRDVRDAPIHLELDRCEERVELVGVTFGYELDSAVGKVANVARNLKTARERLGRKAKAHALNATREINSATIKRHEFRPRLGGHPGRFSLKRRQQPNVYGVSRNILAARTRGRQVVLSGSAGNRILTVEKIGDAPPARSDRRRLSEFVISTHETAPPMLPGPTPLAILRTVPSGPL
jgi:hypothetical protein